MNDFVSAIAQVLLAIVGVAVVAVIVSNRAQTPQVVKSFFDGISNNIGAAVSPVTGSGYGLN